jgi:hypothetical protein
MGNTSILRTEFKCHFGLSSSPFGPKAAIFASGAVADRGWKRSFEDPIPLPRGRQLVTLQDAGDYITKLPKAEHDAAEWQAAMEALLLVVTLGGPTMFARIGVMRALNRNVVRVFKRRMAMSTNDIAILLDEGHCDCRA